MVRLKDAKGLLLITAAVFIGIGVSFGGYGDTLSKAAKICLECIGIG